MKRKDERLEKLWRALREAHPARPGPQPGEGWRGRLMADIRARAEGRARGGATDILASFRGAGRLAPALATAALILFVCGWISFFGAYDEVALSVLTGIPGSLELSAMWF